MNPAELKLRLTPAAYLIGIVSALASAFANVQAFLGNSRSAEQEMLRLFLSITAFWLGIYLWSLVRDACARRRGGKALHLSAVLLAAGLAGLFLGVTLLGIHFASEGDPPAEAPTLLSLILEVGGVTVAAGAARRRAIGARFAVLCLWAGSVITGAMALGFFEKVAEASFDDPARGAFCLVIFHMANACYLFHAAFNWLDRWREMGRKHRVP